MWSQSTDTYVLKVKGNEDVTWPTAYFTIADILYKQYRDVRPLTRHYDLFKAFIQFIGDYYLKEDIVVIPCNPKSLEERRNYFYLGHCYPG